MLLGLCPEEGLSHTLVTQETDITLSNIRCTATVLCTTYKLFTTSAKHLKSVQSCNDKAYSC